MRLIDSVAQCRAAMMVRQDGGQVYHLTGAADYAARVSACPTRFVLADNLTSACAELAFSTGDRLAGCLDLVRVPAQRLWVEWQDTAALKEMQHLLPADGGADSSYRVGAYVESGADGRHAKARIFWLSQCEETPCLAPMDIELKFGGQGASGGEWFRVTDSDDAIAELLDCARFRFDDAWAAYYRSEVHDDAARQAVLRRSLGSVARDIPVLMAFFLLLGCREALSERREDWRALNRKRARQGKSALLEHIEVSLDLSATNASHAGGAPFGESAEEDSLRRRPRFHHVRGHLVRRRSTVYWRRPHGRGHTSMGSIGSRTVTLQFAPRGRERSARENAGWP